jgi:hypothetical protein
VVRNILVVCGRILLIYKGRTTPLALFKEEVHLMIGQNVQLDTRKVQHGIPEHLQSAHVATYRIDLVIFQTDRPEILEDVGQQSDIGVEIDVVVISKGLAAKIVPYLLSVGVVIRIASSVCEFVVKVFDGWQIVNIQSLGRVHIVVAKDPLLLEEFDSDLDGTSCLILHRQALDIAAQNRE